MSNEYFVKKKRLKKGVIYYRMKKEKMNVLMRFGARLRRIIERQMLILRRVPRTRSTERSMNAWSSYM